MVCGNIEPNEEEIKIFKSPEYQAWRTVEAIRESSIWYLWLVAMFSFCFSFMYIGVTEYIFDSVGFIFLVSFVIRLYFDNKSYRRRRFELWGVRNEV